jgi:hypothetical protein
VIAQARDFPEAAPRAAVHQALLALQDRGVRRGLQALPAHRRGLEPHRACPAAVADRADAPAAAEIRVAHLGVEEW